MFSSICVKNKDYLSGQAPRGVSQKFRIGLVFEPLTICSFRAKLGSTTFENRSFGDKSRLSLNIPISKNNMKKKSKVSRWQAQ